MALETGEREPTHTLNRSSGCPGDFVRPDDAALAIVCFSRRFRIAIGRPRNPVVANFLDPEIAQVGQDQIVAYGDWFERFRCMVVDLYPDDRILFQHPSNLTRRSREVIHMIESVDRNEAVERACRERHVLRDSGHERERAGIIPERKARFGVLLDDRCSS